MEAAQIWRECYDQKKKRTVVWPAMFFSGFKLQPEKITTGKIRYSRVVWPAVFSGGSNYNQKNYDRKNKRYSRLANGGGSDLAGTLRPEKNVQSSGQPCFLAGSNYNWIKLWPEKKVKSSGRQLETGKSYVMKKKVQSSGRWLEDKTQNTTHIIDITTNKMSCATLPSSSFAPSSLSMGGAVVPPNHGAAAPQRHAQRYRVKECLVS
jgi:hypothetical protein